MSIDAGRCEDPLVPKVAPRLVIVQATPLCNLNCTYCYVPDRRNKNTVTKEVLRAIASFVFACDFPEHRVDILWHAGEPMAAGQAFYEEAFEVFAQLTPDHLSLQYVMQTNGTLITDAWCKFFVKHRVRIGLSLDGPAMLHDANRRTWGGEATHARVMRGYRLLRAEGIYPGAICVLTRESLKYPDQIYDFFKENEFASLAFNVEEREGARHISSLSDLSSGDVGREYSAFMSRIWDRWRNDGSSIQIREFQHLLEYLIDLRNNCNFVREPDETVPFRIITIRMDGAVSTLSPELISAGSLQYGDFIVGNVLTDTPSAVAHNLISTRFYDDAETSRRLCKRSCSYYALCGGGLYSNKFEEHGTLLATETSVCRLHRQILTDVVLNKLVFESEMCRKSSCLDTLAANV